MIGNKRRFAQVFYFASASVRLNCQFSMTEASTFIYVFFQFQTKQKEVHVPEEKPPLKVYIDEILIFSFESRVSFLLRAKIF